MLLCSCAGRRLSGVSWCVVIQLSAFHVFQTVMVCAMFSDIFFKLWIFFRITTKSFPIFQRTVLYSALPITTRAP